MSEQDSDASDRKKMRSDHKTEMDLLTEQRKQLEDDNKRLQREIQRLQAKNFEADQDLELAAKESLEVVKLRDMLMAKEREIIYLGEQCLNAKEKLEAFHKNYFLVPTKNQYELQIATLQYEYNSLSDESRIMRRDLQMFKAKAGDLQSQLESKDMAMDELRKSMDMIAENSRTEKAFHEQRVEGLERIVVHLEKYILALYSELGMKKHADRLEECLRMFTEERNCIPRDFDVAAHVVKHQLEPFCRRGQCKLALLD